jgi:hypothetical protein
MAFWADEIVRIWHCLTRRAVVPHIAVTFRSWVSPAFAKFACSAVVTLGKIHIACNGKTCSDIYFRWIPCIVYLTNRYDFAVVCFIYLFYTIKRKLRINQVNSSLLIHPNIWKFEKVEILQISSRRSRRYFRRGEGEGGRSTLALPPKIAPEYHAYMIYTDKGCYWIRFCVT